MAVIDIKVPQTNVNDTAAKVVAWHGEDGGAVRAGELLVVIETSKAAEEIVAPATGFLRIAARPGSEVAVGGRLGWLADSVGELPGGEAAAGGAVKATDKARALAAELGVELAALKVAGIITEKHVRDAAGATAPTAPAAALPVPAARVVPLSRVQLGVRAAVMRSRDDAVSAHLLGETVVDRALERLDAIVDEQGLLVTLTDLAIHQAARALTAFPRLNAALVGDSVHEYAEINVGATIEAGGELYVAVIHGADGRALAEIAERRQEIAFGLFKGAVDPEALARGTFTVTVLDQPALAHQLPVIFPGQAAILGLGAPRRVVRPDEDGTLAVRTVIGLTLAYDHRFVNGAEAARFLQAVADGLADPEV